MTIRISAFKWVPPFAQGLVRDLRVRWALEEAGLEYTVNLVSLGDNQKSREYRQKQPFGQVPIYEEGDLTLFESGSIVLHIAKKSKALGGQSDHLYAQTTTWVFAALNSVEPFAQGLAEIDIFHKNEEWTKARRPQVEASLRKRLQAVNTHLKDRSYLIGDEMTVADMIMTTVIRLVPKDIINDFKELCVYLENNTLRPAFLKALDDQLKVFKKHEVENN